MSARQPLSRTLRLWASYDDLAGHLSDPETAQALTDYLHEAADEIDRLTRWKVEATEVIKEWEKVHEALGSPAEPGQSKAEASERAVRALLSEYERLVGLTEASPESIYHEAANLRAENEAWMNGVADAVERLGYDREAACGPADLLPGLITLRTLGMASCLAEVRVDALWLAALARDAHPVGEMAHRVERAAERVLRVLDGES